MTAADGPGFLLMIGAPKAGTSTLAAWLRQRPEMTQCRVKGPRFFTDFAQRKWRGPFAENFAQSLITDEQPYLGSFQLAGRPRWLLDGSTYYLRHPPALDRIRGWARAHPVKLIAICAIPWPAWSRSTNTPCTTITSSAA